MAGSRDIVMPRRPRKRSLAQVGRLSTASLWIAASAPLCWASRHELPQHLVPPAGRDVPYGTPRQTRRTLAQFWIPSPHDEPRAAPESQTSPPPREASEPLFLGRQRGLSERGDVDFHSHVLVDAWREDVDRAFRELRRNGKRRHAEQGGGSPSNTKPGEAAPAAWSWLLRRGAQEKQGGGRGSSNAVATAEAAPSSTFGFVNVVGGDDADANNQSDSRGDSFNVTAGTEYGVVNRTGSTAAEGSDSTTAVYTDSELANRTHHGNSTAGSDDEAASLPPFRPIRIRAYLSEIGGAGRFLTDHEHYSLLQDMVRPALLSWSAALRVDPVQGNLTVDAAQLVDGETCGPGRSSGLPSVPIPPSHLVEGVANTDLLVYLSVGFVDPNRTAQNAVEGWVSRPSSNSSNNYDTTTQMPTPPPTEPPRSSAEPGAGTSGAAAVTPPTAASSVSSTRSWTDAGRWRDADRPPLCRGDYLAASAICSTDQYDRPTAAILHVCVDETFFRDESLPRNLATLRHELGHALGFNSMSLAHFRRPDGTPLTPRVNGTVPLTEVECTGPVNERQVARVALPAEDILRFRTVRGGVRVAEVVTPSVAQVVRNHFDCQTLPGAELESGEFLPLSTDALETSCIGDHWERRLFKTDLMNPVVDGVDFGPRISTLNLAYFADSGWYQVDLSRAASPAGWGRAAGCDFTDQPCIDSAGQVPAAFQETFCNDNPGLDADGYATDISGCTPDLAKKAACMIERYDGALPSEYQYFNGTYGSDVGGNDPLMDFCPVYSGFANGLCSDSGNEAYVQVDKIERFGDRNSRCIPGLVSSRRTALCLRIACVVEDRSFHVQVDGVWTACSRKGQVLETTKGDRVYCPDPIRVCPTFYCQTDCLGTDYLCNYTAGKCECARNCTDDEDEAPFYDPLLNATSPSLPDEDSPLSDYYVPTSRMLTNETRRFALDDRAIVAIALGCVSLLGLLLLACGCRRCRGDDSAAGDGADDDDDRPAATTAPAANPNKDKMLATVVLDLRMNATNLRDAVGDRASETDLSLTDTDGGGTYATDLSGEFHPRTLGGLDGPAPDDEYEDPLARPMVVRRRNVRDALSR